MRLAFLCAVTLSLTACGSSFLTTRSELEMTRYDPAPGARAVVLERAWRLVLGYELQVDTEDPGYFDSDGASNAGEQGHLPPMAGTIVPDDSGKLGGPLGETGVTSFTLEVVSRTKILTQAGLAAARMEEPLPSGAHLESLTAATLLPDGRVLEVEPAAIQTGGDTLCIEFPGALVGAVLEVRYKIYSHEPGGLLGWPIQQTLPLARASLRIKLRAGAKLPWRFTGSVLAPSEPRVEAALGQGLSRSAVLSWVFENLPAATTGAPSAALVFGE